MPLSGSKARIKRAIYPGSFDPITYGHLDVIKRAKDLIDELVVAVALNPKKDTLFSLDERVEMVSEAVKDICDIKVVGFDCLLVDKAAEIDAQAIIRGLRAVTDFEYELMMALMNRKLNNRIESVFLMPASKYIYLTSTIVKEVASLGGCISGFVPPNVEKMLAKKFSHEK